jgi:hypothetical protein
MKRGDFFRRVWLSPLALVTVPETPPNGSSTTNPRSAPLAQVPETTPAMLNVRAFGAVGDGNADDTGPIEVAINASGGTVPVYFPDGTYKITRQLVLTVTSYSLAGARTERNGGQDQATTICYRPSAPTAMVSISDTVAPSLDLGPFEHEDLRFDVNDATQNPGLFVFGDETTPIASQRKTFGIRFERCYLLGVSANPASTSAGVLTRTGQRFVHMTACFETVFEDVRLIGGDNQIRCFGCDKPVFSRVRSLFSHLPFSFEGDSSLTVQHSFNDVQVEGWSLTPVSIKNCTFSGSNLRFENTDASETGMGWFMLPAITVAATVNTDAYTFSAPMDNILFPDLSIIKISEGSDEHVALVKTVRGTAVTVYADQNVLLWTASTATVKRLHGYGPLHNSAHDSSFANVSVVTSLNSPAFVYHVTNGMMLIANAHEPFGAGANDQTSLAIGNKFSGVNNLNSQMVFSGCHPFVVADPSSPFVNVSNVRSDYGGRAHPELGRTAFQTDKRSRMADLFYERSLTRRTWAWTPKSYAEDNASSPYAIPLLNIRGEPNTNEFVWVWDMRRDVFMSAIRLTDESLPSVSGALRVAFRVKGSDNTSVLSWRTIGDGNGLTNSVTLAGVWQTVEAFLQTIPSEWTGGSRSTQTGIEVLTAFTTAFSLAGVVVEELPLFLTAKIVTLTDAATIAVDTALGGKFSVTLTANRTMDVPTNPAIGQEIEFDIVQDDVGGHSLAWNAAFKEAWSDTGNTLSKRSTIRYYYDGMHWMQMGAQSPYI